MESSVLALTKQFPLGPNTHRPNILTLDTMLLLLPRFMGTETRDGVEPMEPRISQQCLTGTPVLVS